MKGKIRGTPSPESVSTKLHGVAKLARRMPEVALTTLAHHIDESFLREAWGRTRKSGAAGVDGLSAAMYEVDLEENLGSLLTRMKTGSYRAPPVRRTYIPKADGRLRPIGIPTIEDKVLQRAVTMVLEAVYEEEFLDCSYGFRQGRSAHQALEHLRDGLMEMKGGWIVELDIESFFDTVVPGHLRSFLDRRVRDGVLRRLIDKWLKAGVMEDGRLQRSDTGTPQGGVISPLLANIYLHEVLDRWFEEQVRPRMHGRAFLTRFADDAVLAFEREEDAKRVMAVLPKRFGKYGLRLHPEKTRLVEFRRPTGARAPRGRSFDLLGFRHYWARSRKGHWVVLKKTAPSRFSRTLKTINVWCRRNRHEPVPVQQKQLAQKLNGHYAYFGVIGNARGLWRLYFEVKAIWRKWLDRRSQRGRMRWERFKQLLRTNPLPPPRLRARHAGT